MSEHMFGVTRKTHNSETLERADAIARRHGCYAVTVKLPGDPTRGWFAGPNLGHPFDRDREEAVMADLSAAGIDW